MRNSELVNHQSIRFNALKI